MSAAQSGGTELCPDCREHAGTPWELCAACRSRHGVRDDAMGWLVRYAASDAVDAHQAREVVRYVDRLRDEINWRREIHEADVVDLQTELLGARMGR